jgi:hypothetical protein
MALFVQETPKMGGVPVDKGGREEHLNFEHKEFAISVQFRPDEHVASSAHAAARSKTTNHFDKLAKNDPLAQPAFWGKLGALLHSGQASHLTELRGQLKEAMKTKQAEVSNAERSVEQKPKLAKVKVPRLNLETAMKTQASKSLTTRSLREDYDEGSISPSGPFSARVLREALTDRGKRQQWLASTKEFSKDSILEPYAVTERQATAFKLLAKQEMVIEEQVVRGEAQRISDILHRVNVSLMKGTATSADPGARERHNTMEDIQQELKEQTDKLRNIIKSSATIDGDERFLKSTPHRYKFTKANQEGTAHTRLVFRGPQYTRNAVIWTDKSDSALYNKAKLSFKLAEQVEDGLIRRALRAQAGIHPEAILPHMHCTHTPHKHTHTFQTRINVHRSNTTEPTPNSYIVFLGMCSEHERRIKGSCACATAVADSYRPRTILFARSSNHCRSSLENASFCKVNPKMLAPFQSKN